MILELLDEYVINVLRESGWSEHRKQDIQYWIKVLTEEGYVVNDYAQSILQELGDLQFNTAGDKNHWGVQLEFNPVNAASGEYDRMEIFNKASNDELFPIGLCFSWIVYVGSNKKVYLGDWQSLSIAGNSIEEFLNKIFTPHAHFEEIYTNPENWNIRRQASWWIE